MRIIYQSIYNLLLLPLLTILAAISSLFNKKIRIGFCGRFNSIGALKQFSATIEPDDFTYWFHAASLGEYKQVQPVLAGIKEIEPNAKIVVSFFSPSGYTNVHDEKIDCKIYLPFDFIWSVNRALSLVQPRKLIFAAYDIWPNLIWSANKRKVNTTLFAARFVPGTTKLCSLVRNFYRSVYSYFDTIYTVDEADHVQVQKLIRRNKQPILRVLGNPRYDQVKEKADTFTTVHTETVLERDKRIIAGSIHEEDEAIIIDGLVNILKKYADVTLAWVPHDPDDNHISRAETIFTQRGFSCERMGKKTIDLPSSKVVLVDVVGILSQLYWEGQIAYIGGGFSTGVHNTMEPAISRLPVIFGPKNKKFHAPGALIKSGGGFEIKSSVELQQILDRLLSDPDFFLQCSYAATEVIHSNLGSATRVVRGIIRD